MTYLSTLATIFGTIGGLANLPQAYKIFKRKSAKDISILAYSMLLAGAVIWLLYGLEIGNFAVILTNLFGTANIGLVVVGWLLYGRKLGRRKRGEENEGHVHRP